MVNYEDYLDGKACSVCYDAQFLLDSGVLGDYVAARMGYSPKGLAFHLQRHAPDLAERLSQARRFNAERIKA